MVPKFHRGKNTSQSSPRKVDGTTETFVVSTEENLSKTNTSGDIKLVQYSYYLNSLELRIAFLYPCHFDTVLFSYGPFKKKLYQHLKELTHQSTNKTQELTGFAIIT